MERKNLYSQFYEEAIHTSLADSEQFPCLSHLESHTTHYTQRTLLGKGALKEVYRAFDERAQRWVALALLRPELEQKHSELFVKEAWLTSYLNHPNIIKIFEVGLDKDERPFFTMDLKSNQTLSDLVQQDPPLQTLLEAFLKVCDAISYAHAQHVYHLDLKPDNIQCDDYGQVLVCDWGLAELSPTHTINASAQTVALLQCTPRTQSVKGTPGFMAPEQASGSPHKDHRTDLYALGAILHFILTGQPPFIADSTETTDTTDSLLSQTRQSDLTPPHLAYPERSIPPALSAIVCHAMQRRPEDRYRSVDALKADLNNYLHHRPTTAQNPGFITKARYFIQRHRKPLTVAASLGLLAVLSVFLWSQLHTAEDNFAVAQEEKAEISQKHDELRQTFILGGLNLLEDNGPPLTLEHRAERILYFTQFLQENPGNRQVSTALFYEYCAMMNFKQAIAVAQDMPKAPREIHTLITAVLDQFAHYEFNENARPTPEEIEAVFHTTLALEKPLPAVLHKIYGEMLYYDMLTPHGRKRQLQRRKQLQQSLILLLDLVNQQTEGYQSHYQVDTNTLTITASSPLSLPSIGGHRKFFSYLHLRRLDLELPEVSLNDLQLLHCQQLNLSKCKQLPIRKSIRLKIADLKTLEVSSKYHTPKVVQRYFMSSLMESPPTIIWHD